MATSVLGGENLLREEDFKISLWNFSGMLRGGLGYNDNVLLSHSQPQGSAFWMSGAEVMLFRLPSHGWQWNFFAEASDTRYFNAGTVDNEQSAVAVAQVVKTLNRGWQTALSANYMFQNQVFDNSTLYTNATSVGLILGHTLTPRWNVRKTWDSYWLEGEVSGTRQWLDAPLDDYWQFGPRTVFGRNWNRRAELTLALQFYRLDYDTRPQVDRLGVALPNSRLSLNSPMVEVAFRRYWDAQKHWQTISMAGFEAPQDNGSGFYDYYHYRFSQKVVYRDRNWEITAQFRLSHYDFPAQNTSVTEWDRRRKMLLGLTMRVERKLSRRWLVHASLSWDRSLSNLDFDDYEGRTVMGGLALTF